jgi:hypothetical protein
MPGVRALAKALKLEHVDFAIQIRVLIDMPARGQNRIGQFRRLL